MRLLGWEEHGQKKNKITIANQWWGRLMGSCKFRANTFQVVVLWKRVAVPSILYAKLAYDFTMEQIRKLERGSH